ncbi:class I SAM-dependent methyltransferase [Streptomyces sp. NPDC058872]|uniref:class I SAM-dependent methyltransferase n=1 Tax=Streptomyces sp. NPDC058872 TaxID=3346661 RepID=UPI00369D99C9
MVHDPDTFDTAMAAWQEWQEAPWGRLRYALAEANLVRDLGDGCGAGPRRILDLAGGDGGDALRLAARGHLVTVVDHAPAMLAAAEARAAERGLSDRVTCVRADVHAMPVDLVEGDFDVVLCHNLLPYVEDAATTLAAVLAPLGEGGLLSVMAINRHSAPLNIAVREANPAAALAALDEGRLQNEMFDSQLALHTAEEIIPVLGELGCEDVRHYGIRSFCDYLTDDARKYDESYYADLERLELATTARPPYMHTARLFQLTARRRKVS